MSKGQVHIRCYKCGEFNANAEKCEHCGATLDLVKRREQERQDFIKEKERIEILKGPSKVDRFFSAMTNHRWLLVRLVFKLIYGVWIVFMAIVMFIAWFIGVVVA